MERFIYADNAATTKLDIDAFEAMKPYLLDEYGNASQPYSFARKPKQALKEARKIIARCINAEPDEIYFTSGGTESDNWAIKGTLFASKDKKATITSSFEHHAIIHTCEAMERLGYPVVYINPNNTGVVTPNALDAIITPQTLLVSIMMSNNEIGTIQPIKELTEIAHRNGAIFHTDAVQCVGHISIDVKKLNVDMLSASAHKFNGPKGIGFIYIKKGTPISSLLHGGSQEKMYRAGTENIAAIVGMAVALQKNCTELEENKKHLVKLENTLFSMLESNGVSFVQNGTSERVPGNLSLSFPGFEGETLLHRLDLMGIIVSTGSACDSVNTQISHVLRAINTDEKIARGTLRISFGKENTIDDAKNIAISLNKIIANN